MVRILGNNKNAELLRGNYDGVDATGKEVNSSEKQFVAFEPNQIKSATDNIGTFSTENDDIQMAIDTDYVTNTVSDDEKEEIYTQLKKINRAKRTLIDTGQGLYLTDHSDAEGLYRDSKTKEPKGFQVKLWVDTREYTKEEIETIKEEIENGTFRNQEDVNRWTKEHIGKQGRYNSDSIDAEVRKSNADNAGLDTEASQRESLGEPSNSDSQEDFGADFIKVRDSDGTNSKRVVPRDFFSKKNDIPFYLLKTTKGEVEIYGFIDPETKDMYLDETVISPEHPIHEYTHLWDRAVAERNLKLWARGVELMKKFLYTKNGKKVSLWEEVENDPNYGQKWQKYKTSDPARYEFLVASEVHARLVGESGAAFMEKYAQENGADNLIDKLKKWIADVWKALAETFGVWKKEDLDKLTLADFNHMTVRDLVQGTLLKGNKVAENGAMEGAEGTAEGNAEKPFITNIKMWDEPLYVPTKEHALAIQKLYYMHDFMDDAKFKEWEDRILDASKEKVVELEKRIPISPEMLRLWQGDKFDIMEQIEEESKHPYEAPDERKPPVTPTESEEGAQEENTPIEGETDETADTDADEMIPEPNPYEVSLTNYESYTGRSGDISVDAEWKVKELQELDSQINTNNPKAQNEMIIDKIKGVLRCKDQSELKKALKNAEKLARYGEMNRQMDNLNKSDLLTSTQVRHAAEQIVDSISDMITDIQSNPDGASRLFPHLNIQKDLTKESRQEIVRTIGIDSFIQKAKENFDPEFNMRLKGERDYDQADLLYDNWDALMELGAASFVANESFGIRKNYSKDGFSIANSMKLEVDETGHNDIDSIGEMEGDAQEHWQIEFRTVDILNSMSEIVRTSLHKCYVLDKDGNQIVSKWGVPERVNKKEAVQSILKWTQGALTLEQMVDKLSTRTTEAPWLTQLISRLTDTTGNEADFQSQFFGVMNKHWQLYSIVRNKNGKFVCMPVNENPALKVMMNTLKAQIKLRENPMFNLDGTVNEKHLGLLHQYYDELNKICENIHNREQESKRRHFGEIVGVELTEEERASALRCLIAASRVFGFDIPEANWDYVVNIDNVKMLTSKLSTIIKKGFDMAVRWEVKDYDPFAYKGDFSITGATEDFISPVADRMDNTIASSFYSDGKMYQSYVIPSYMTKLMAKLRNNNYKELVSVLTNEYGKSEWFRKQGKAIGRNVRESDFWRNSWIKWMLKETNEDEEPVLRHKVELNFNKHSYMRTMNDNEYALSLIAEYFSEQKGQRRRKLAWYRVPMLSNKPSSEFIRFYRFSKKEILDGMFDMFCQELSRIQTVRMRNKSKGDVGYIKNFDENGRKFCFLPFLNEHLSDKATGRLAELLKEKVNSNKEMGDADAELIKLVTEAIEAHMNKRTQSIMEDWERKGILKAAQKIEGIGKEEDEVREKIEEFLWNDNFAAKNILQITIGDIAFYKDAEDLQKRLAQIHAPGTRANVNATDYNGAKVSDGIYRTIILKDFDNFASNIIANISEVFDRRIARAKTDQERKTLEAMKDSLVRPPKTIDDKDSGGAYWNINVADAQGYSSPSSYRKKALMFGKWSKEAEMIYQDLLKGEYDYTSLQVAFQPLKPFVYSRIEKSMGVDKAPIKTMFSPFQAKNAEYLLIMADAMIKGEEKQSGAMSRPNLLKAVYELMEDSAYDKVTVGKDGKKIRESYNRRGIDTVQFESAIKSSLQTPLDINQYLNDAEGEEKAYNYLREHIYVDKKDAAGNRVYDEYDDVNYVQQALFEDYCLQQEVPEHFKEHEQTHGSQIRMITPADLDLYDNDNASHDEESNKVYYEWKDAKEGNKKVDARKFREEYEETIGESIEESLNELSKELHLESTDMRERNIILSEFLQREILDSPRYGTDLFLACSVDKETGKFRIPKGDPVQAKRIEQLINSLIKNRVNKQTIPGGPIVQVSNYGLSRQLNIRFKKKGTNELLDTKDEYLEKVKKNAELQGITMTQEQLDAQYKEYCRLWQGGIAYFECLAPIWSDDLVEKFGKPDGTIDIEAMEALDPDLLEMVSYRIPTEDKYSCAPMKVVGFLPREAGEAIILPYELTGIDGSDFDVDKRYVMRKSIDIRPDWEKIRKALYGKAIASYEKSTGKAPTRIAKSRVNEQVRMFLDNPERMKSADPLMESLYDALQEMLKGSKYMKTAHPVEGKRYRDNKVIDMTWAVLTHEKTADKILNPGGFDEQKRMGYLISAYKNPANRMNSWNDLNKLKTEELKKKSYVEKDLTWADTQIHFYHQNNAGSSLIGVFAVNKVAHATLQDDNIFVAIDEVCGKKPFAIAGFDFKGRMRIDPMYDSNGNLVGKGLGSLVAASADTAKDPVLDLMNINMQTAAILTSMVRMGMPFEDAALFLSQPVITEVLDEYYKRSLTSRDSIEKIVSEKRAVIEQSVGIDNNSGIHQEDLEREDLIAGLRGMSSLETTYKVLEDFLRMKALADAMKKVSFPTRFNSIASAVGPLVVDNIILRRKMNELTKENTPFYDGNGDNAQKVGTTEILKKHKILEQFSHTVDTAEQLFKDTPVGSARFSNFLTNMESALGKDFADTIHRDRGLLDQLSIFFQSSIIINSGLVDESKLGYYIEEFPKEFFNKKYKQQYADNPLIARMEANTSATTGRIFLQINTTGMEATEKDSLSSAWFDLHKKNPQLAKQLFDYCFFRGGIGFTPKTFISLLNTYMKEALENPDATNIVDGKIKRGITYVEVFDKIPQMTDNNIWDQFVRNNWDEKRLAKKVKLVEGDKIDGNEITFQGPRVTAPYIQIENGASTTLLRLKEKKEEENKEGGENKIISTAYEMVMPLGDNKEYVEISKYEIKTPYEETTSLLSDEDSPNDGSNDEMDVLDGVQFSMEI